MGGTSVATLNSTGSKARFGVAYLRSVCSQAGVGFSETEPDEDALAVDGEVKFAEASVRVQVKCSGQFKIDSTQTATWPVKPEWRDKWSASLVPVYFVLVIVDPDKQSQWLHHNKAGTLLRAAAFWVRVNNVPQGQNIIVPKSQRLTADTLSTWKSELISGYFGGQP